MMDFIEGETLESICCVKRAPSCYLHSKGLPLHEVLDIGLQLCATLGYLHTQQPPVIFRDLKPGNVMRTASGHLVSSTSG